jgi:predicted metal-dependent HD superfamily phosphohydrolase
MASPHGAETQALAERFQGAWQALGAKGDAAAAFAELTDRYGHGRHYHDFGHIAAMFAMARRWVPAPLSPTLTMAIFYHDAVYDPQRHDNEARSAELAVARLAGSPPAALALIDLAIRATEHHQADHPEAQLLIDLDLSFLGASLREFAANVTKLVREFAHLPRQTFLRGQARYLQPFLDQPHIYYTPVFRQRFEARARRNLQRFIATYASPAP